MLQSWRAPLSSFAGKFSASRMLTSSHDPECGSDTALLLNPSVLNMPLFGSCSRSDPPTESASCGFPSAFVFLVRLTAPPIFHQPTFEGSSAREQGSSARSSACCHQYLPPFQRSQPRLVRKVVLATCIPWIRSVPVALMMHVLPPPCWERQRDQSRLLQAWLSGAPSSWTAGRR